MSLNQVNPNQQSRVVQQKQTQTAKPLAEETTTKNTISQEPQDQFNASSATPQEKSEVQPSEAQTSTKKETSQEDVTLIAHLKASPEELGLSVDKEGGLKVERSIALVPSEILDSPEKMKELGIENPEIISVLTDIEVSEEGAVPKLGTEFETVVKSSPQNPNNDVLIGQVEVDKKRIAIDPETNTKYVPGYQVGLVPEDGVSLSAQELSSLKQKIVAETVQEVLPAGYEAQLSDQGTEKVELATKVYEAGVNLGNNLSVASLSGMLGGIGGEAVQNIAGYGAALTGPAVISANLKQLKELKKQQTFFQNRIKAGDSDIVKMGQKSVSVEDPTTGEVVEQSKDVYTSAQASLKQVEQQLTQTYFKLGAGVLSTGAGAAAISGLQGASGIAMGAMAPLLGAQLVSSVHGYRQIGKEIKEVQAAQAEGQKTVRVTLANPAKESGLMEVDMPVEMRLEQLATEREGMTTKIGGAASGIAAAGQAFIGGGISTLGLAPISGVLAFQAGKSLVKLSQEKKRLEGLQKEGQITYTKDVITQDGQVQKQEVSIIEGLEQIKSAQKAQKAVLIGSASGMALAGMGVAGVLSLATGAAVVAAPVIVIGAMYGKEVWNGVKNVARKVGGWIGLNKSEASQNSAETQASKPQEAQSLAGMMRPVATLSEQDKAQVAAFQELVEVQPELAQALDKQLMVFRSTPKEGDTTQSLLEQRAEAQNNIAPILNQLLTEAPEATQKWLESKVQADMGLAQQFVEQQSSIFEEPELKEIGQKLNLSLEEQKEALQILAFTDVSGDASLVVQVESLAQQGDSKAQSMQSFMGVLQNRLAD